MVLLELPWLFFLGASIVVILAPGQDLVLVMSRGIGQGPAAGVVTAAGVSTGLLGHTLAATLGLGAILVASEMAYTVMKYIGAAYLGYLGLRLIASGSCSLATQRVQQKPLTRLFVEGALSNLSNPKIVLFYFAFLPQFVPASMHSPTLAIFALGSVFALTTFLIKGPFGYFAGSLSAWLRARPAVLTWIYRSSGALLVGLGLRLVFEER